MTSTTQPFQWIDRDTAARDLLQLAYHAPPYIRDQAWKLLSAIRSSALIPELKTVVMDADNPHALAAFQAIAATPGNVLFPEFETLENLSLQNQFDLLENHPVNQDWIIPLIEKEPPYNRRQLIWLGLQYIPDTSTSQWIALYEENTLLPDLYMAYRLYKTGNKTVREWLQQRWDELIYLCLIYDKQGNPSPYETDLFQILDEWPELKADLFRRCPAIQEEVEQKKKAHAEKHTSSLELLSTPIWKRIERIYEQALAGDQKAFESLSGETNSKDKDNCAAIAMYFMGKFAPKNDRAFQICLSHLKSNAGIQFHFHLDRLSEYTTISSIIRDEAALALSTIVTPATWEGLLEAYFLFPGWYLERRMHRWIKRLTDQLSGVMPTVVEYPVQDVQNRLWSPSFFKSDPVKPDPQSAAMYAEYYGAEPQPVETSSAG